MPNFVAFGRTVAEIWQCFDISKWRLSAPPCWILKKIKKFNSRKG